MLLNSTFLLKWITSGGSWPLFCTSMCSSELPVSFVSRKRYLFMNYRSCWNSPRFLDTFLRQHPTVPKTTGRALPPALSHGFPSQCGCSPLGDFDVILGWIHSGSKYSALILPQGRRESSSKGDVRSIQEFYPQVAESILGRFSSGSPAETKMRNHPSSQIHLSLWSQLDYWLIRIFLKPLETQTGWNPPPEA